MEIPENLTEVMMEEDDKENAPDLEQPNKPKKFMLSGYTDGEKTQVAEFLERHQVQASMQKMSRSYVIRAPMSISKL
jgi:hypothetical protein